MRFTSAFSLTRFSRTAGTAWLSDRSATKWKTCARAAVTAASVHVALLSACSEDLQGPGDVVASVQVTPSSVSLVSLGETAELGASAKDAGGGAIAGKTFTWTSSDEGIATVSASGLVTAVGNGSCTITAVTEGISGEATATVAQEVVAVDLTPSSAVLTSVGETVQLIAHAGDANGNTVDGVTFDWESSDEVVATVNAGLVTAVGSGEATITAEARGILGNAAVTVVITATVSTGYLHTCALTIGGSAYCWGYNDHGQLGDGTTDDRTIPEPVAGGLSFASVTAGLRHTCGVTTDGSAYCWGRNVHGELGNGGTTEDRTIPEPVAGGLSFASVAPAPAWHTCAVTADGSAYCWGWNQEGELGGGTTVNRMIPGPVAGGLTFASVTPGTWHTCGVTTDGSAYCWGSNQYGALGDGTTDDRTTPGLVAGGLRFTSLTAGSDYTCGVTTDGSAYCWGSDSYGRLGHGTVGDRTMPELVAGGLSFASVTAGAYHACGVTTGGSAYCWGRNNDGQLGDGTTTDRRTPGPVAGELTFASLTAGVGQSCGVTTEGSAYCWGSNQYGALGDGTAEDRHVPVRVMW